LRKRNAHVTSRRRIKGAAVREKIVQMYGVHVESSSRDKAEQTGGHTGSGRTGSVAAPRGWRKKPASQVYRRAGERLACRGSDE